MLRSLPQIPRSLEDDFSTIFSIVPFSINEFKPGIYPGRFMFQPCLDVNKPEMLIITASVHFVEQYNGNEPAPSLQVWTSSREMASSIVNDYMHGQIGGVDKTCKPGFAWLPGRIEIQEFLTKHKDLHKNMIEAQLTWFGALVKQADNDWNRHHRHSVISQTQIYAADKLGLKRDWMLPDAADVPVKCPACLSNCDPRAIVCATCNFILDKKRYNAADFAA